MSLSQAAASASGAPCVFKGCRGVFHPAAGSLGVVLCPPWGEEALRAREAWRALAHAIAAAGYPCLGFDYRGTGDSIGAMTDPEDMADWTATIDSAADFLRAYSGVKTFVLVGQGLGAGLAMRAAGLRADVVGLHLLAPIASGRAYVGGIAGFKHDDGGVSVNGFVLAAHMVASLKGFDATRSGLGGLAQVIVFDQTNRKAGAEVSEFYKRGGIATCFVPLASGRRTDDMATIAGPRIIEGLRAIKPVAPAKTPVRVPLLPATLRASDYREEPLRLGDGAAGMFCLPLHASRDGPVFVFVTEAGTSRIGWGRTFVEHARALASLGFASLRLDPLASSDDASVVFDILTARGHARILLVGVGEAATTALAAGNQDPRVTDIIAVNPPRLLGDQTERLDRPGGPAGAWSRLFEALMPAALHARLTPLAHTICAFAAPRISSPRSSQGSSQRVKALFSGLSQRGARVSLVYGDTDVGLHALRLVFGPLGRSLKLPGTSVSIMPGADPCVTNPQAAAMLRDHLIVLGREAAETIGGYREAA